MSVVFMLCLYFGAILYTCSTVVGSIFKISENMHNIVYCDFGAGKNKSTTTVPVLLKIELNSYNFIL